MLHICTSINGVAPIALPQYYITLGVCIRKLTATRMPYLVKLSESVINVAIGRCLVFSTFVFHFFNKKYCLHKGDKADYLTI